LNDRKDSKNKGHTDILRRKLKNSQVISSAQQILCFWYSLNSSAEGEM
jgi:hypothetical protein